MKTPRADREEPQKATTPTRPRGRAAWFAGTLETRGTGGIIARKFFYKGRGAFSYALFVLQMELRVRADFNVGSLKKTVCLKCQPHREWRRLLMQVW